MIGFVLIDVGGTVTNGTWRDGDAYIYNFAGSGVAKFITTAISSVDTGVRKRDVRIYQRAMDVSGVSADECVMIGNSERNDVRTAQALGMRTVRVAIEEPAPASSAADAVVTSLRDVIPVVRTWRKAY